MEVSLLKVEAFFFFLSPSTYVSHVLFLCPALFLSHVPVSACISHLSAHDLFPSPFHDLG